MTPIDWIMSDGGPLICMEECLKQSWGGIVRLTRDDKSGAENDYERACNGNLLVFTVPLAAGHAIILGDRPLNTTFWRSEDGVLHIVRVRWAEAAANIRDVLSKMNFSTLQSIEESIDFVFSSSDIVLFDSVEDGRDDQKSTRNSIPKGKYKISTKIFNQNDLTSLYVHEFLSIPDDVI